MFGRCSGTRRDRPRVSLVGGAGSRYFDSGSPAAHWLPCLPIKQHFQHCNPDQATGVELRIEPSLAIEARSLRRLNSPVGARRQAAHLVVLRLQNWAASPA
jgi:hypothetical protein